MASTKSWLSGISSPREYLNSKSRHDLPRWRSPSPMSSSMIPPPIVQSMYVPPVESMARSALVEQVSPLDGRQRELESDLQYLLDAQAEGLVRGLEGSRDDRSSTGSTTPTIHSTRSPSRTSRVSVPHRRPGLKSARKGIHRAIIALAALKDEELDKLGESIREDDGTLAKIDGWEDKRHRLQQASQHVDAGEDHIRVQRLRQEADVLQLDINKAEQQLMEMKTAHRRLVRQVAAVENSVQAKMASYTSSLRMLEEEISRFLTLQPDVKSDDNDLHEAEMSVWQLPSKKRTLAAAKQLTEDKRERATHQQASIETEKAALKEGADMWMEAVLAITEFERALRDEMAALPSSSSSHSAWEDQEHPQNATESVQGLITRIDAVLHLVEGKHEVASQKQWNLLIAALGAELDALRRGKEILEGLVNIQSSDRSTATIREKGRGGASSGDGDELIDEFNQGFGHEKPVTGQSEGSDADDEPSPELLFSR